MLMQGIRLTANLHKAFFFIWHFKEYTLAYVRAGSYKKMYILKYIYFDIKLILKRFFNKLTYDKN